MERERKARALLSVLVTAHKNGQTRHMAKLSTPKTARIRAREDITSEILTIARDCLGTKGAASISLRSIARDMGMVSSGIYRYVPNRDALLTLLITDAYNGLGAAAEKSERTVPRNQLMDRFLTIAHAVRTWALAYPHEYALIFGTPIPGYKAPADTSAPASRVPLLLTKILEDWLELHPRARFPKMNQTVLASIAPIAKSMGTNLPPDLMLRGLNAWNAMFGLISFELFGHLQEVIASDAKKRKAYFDHQIRTIATKLDLVN